MQGGEKPIPTGPAEPLPVGRGTEEPEGTLTASGEVPPLAPPSPEPRAAELATVPSSYYQIEGEVGRGGVGVVLRAHDRRLSRRVALKQLQHIEPRSRQRFEREMRITAKLQHPGIVPIHEAGVLESGAPFYAMKLIEGRSLKELIAGAATMEARLEFLPTVIAVVETIAYAHSQGVIHRDLKPSNVIVGAFGETVVIDWGLAKDLHVAEGPSQDSGPYRQLPSEDMTVAGSVVGTPAYMPPEQARGEEVDKTADVYALGAMLRQLITGKTPYSAPSSQEVIDAILVGPPPKLDVIAPDAPPDLCALVEKAMARNRGTRYSDAAILLGDLRSFVNGRLVSAYSYAASERLRKWAARRKGIVLTGSVAGVALLLLGMASFLKISLERDGALLSKRDAIGKTNALIREQALHEIDRGFAIGAVEVLKKYPRDATDWKDILPLVSRTALLGLPDTWTFETSAESVSNGVRITPDGRFVVIPRGERLEVWKLAAGRRVAEVQVVSSGARISRFESFFLNRKLFLVVGTDHGDLAFIELDAEGRPLTKVIHHVCSRSSIDSLAANDPGTRVVAGCADGRVFGWSSMDLRWTLLRTHDKGGVAVSFLGEGIVASVAADGVLHLDTWDSPELFPPIGIGSAATVMTAKANCHRVVVGTAKGTIASISGERYSHLEEFTVDAGVPLGGVGLDDNCGFIFGTSVARRFVAFDGRTGLPIFTGSAQNAAVYPNRSAIVIGTDTGELSFFEPLSGWKQSWRVSMSPLDRIMVSDNGVVAALGDALVSFDPVRFPEVFSFGEPVVTLAADADESIVTLGGLHGHLGYLDVDSDSIIDLGQVHTGISLVRSGEFGGIFSVGGRDGCVYAWHGAPLADPLFCTLGGVRDIAVSDPTSVDILTDNGSAIRYKLGQARIDQAKVAGATRIAMRRDGGAVVSSKTGVTLLGASWDEERRIDLGVGVGQSVELGNGDIVAVTTSGEMVEIRLDDTRAHLGRCKSGVHRSWFSSRTSLFLIACEDGSIVAFPEVPGLSELNHGGIAMDADATPSGGAFATCSSRGEIIVVDIDRKNATAFGSTIPLENIEILPKHGLVIASASKQGLVAAWHYRQQPYTFPLNQNALYAWLHPDRKD
jgi:predicted Ser/Thr protein kinase